MISVQTIAWVASGLHVVVHQGTMYSRLSFFLMWGSQSGGSSPFAAIAWGMLSSPTQPPFPIPRSMGLCWAVLRRPPQPLLLLEVGEGGGWSAGPSAAGVAVWEGRAPDLEHGTQCKMVPITLGATHGIVAIFTFLTKCFSMMLDPLQASCAPLQSLWLLGSHFKLPGLENRHPSRPSKALFSANQAWDAALEAVQPLVHQ